MAAYLHSCDHTDEDYIDMEVVSSTSNFFCHSTGSPPPHPREFEFQMFSISSERETTTSPADELFYKGKLLPLHLPPRLQMVEKLLHNSTPHNHKTESFEEFFGTPLITTPAANTPFESCNISPSESFRLSRELNPDENSTDQARSFIGENTKRRWTRKLKLINQSTLSSKWKASRTYLKSLFSKSGCSGESSPAALRNMGEGSVSKTEYPDKYVKKAKKSLFGQIQRDRYQINKEKIAENDGARHRRSFSGAIKRLSTAKSSSGSSSSSCSSNSITGLINESQFLKRSTSMTSDIENSIQGAIAHCKRSQQLFHSRKTLSEVGFCTLSASRVNEDQERPGLCRG